MTGASALLLAVLAPGIEAPDLADVKSRGSLRVLVMIPKQAPNEFFHPEGGDRPGLDREILEGFASLQRVRIEPVPVESWDELVPALLQGRGDLVAGRFTVTAERRRRVAFTAEVFPTRNVVLTRRPHRVVTTLDQFREEKVGTVRGTSMAEAVAAAGVPRANVDDAIVSGQLPAALRSGRATAVVLGIESAIVAQLDDPEIQLGLFLGPPGSLAYALRKEDTQLLRALNEYIEATRRTPTWSRLVVKYFGEKAPEILRKARTE
jgi:ABC-type amino acid transport substrate-binding protein